MPRKRDGKRDAGKDEDQNKLVPTERVRVRSKNPMIGRKMSEAGPESETVVGSSEALTERPLPIPRIVEMDDDATEIASGPPGIPRQDLIARGPEAKRGRAGQLPLHAPVSAPVPEPRPRARMGMMGTKGAGAFAARMKVERIEGQLAPTDVPELKLVRAHLPRESVDLLEQILSGRFDDKRTRGSESPKRALERLIHAPEYGELSIPDRAKLLGTIAGSPADITTIGAALRLVQSRAVGTFDPRDRGLLLELFDALQPSERAELGAVAERSLHGRTALHDRDFEDASVVRHLHTLARARRLAHHVEAAGIKKPHVLAMLLGALARPISLSIEDGGDGVLGMLEFALADGSPAELARLWCCLVTGEMKVALPDEGSLDLAEALRTQPGLQLSSANSPLRAGLEQLVGLAHPRAGPKRSALVMPGGSALDADVTARALGYMYGVGFTVAAGAASALRHLDGASQDRERVPPVFVTLLHERGERLFVFDHVDRERVYVRAPHGSSSKVRGGRRLDPVRRVEDPARGVDSLTRGEVEQAVGVAIVPRT